jgi:hypothetical protein
MTCTLEPHSVGWLGTWLGTDPGNKHMAAFSVKESNKRPIGCSIQFVECFRFVNELLAGLLSTLRRDQSANCSPLA